MVVLQGENAQGKTNLLEAVFLLATARSHRTTNDGELLCWTVLEEEMPYARLVGAFHGAAGPLAVELVVMGQPQGYPSAKFTPSILSQSKDEGLRTGPAAGEGQVSRVQKRLRINGVARRALDLLGQVPVVLFSPEEVDLVAGAPTLRRRYLDLLLSQLDPQYARTLQRYQRVLLQRNHLLRLIREGQASAAELAFWDDELVGTGSYLLRGRIEAIAVLEQEAQRIHAELTDGRERLGLAYQSALAPESAEPSTKLTPSILSLSKDEGLRTKASLDAVSARFRAALAEVQRREIAQGQSVRGPHRDDLRFSVDGADMGVYGSRGQQRTAVLSLKLAEAAYLKQRLGEPPLLLLDDVLSELDETRRAYLLRAAARLPQCLITTTDPSTMLRASADPLVLGGAPPAARFRVHAGVVTPG